MLIINLNEKQNMDYKKFESEHGIQRAERMIFIDFQLRFTSTIRRSDIIDQFGVAESAASKEIAEYKKLAPGNVDYDHKRRSNVVLQSYKPIFNIGAEQGLGMLANGFNKNLLFEKPIAPYQRVGIFPRQLDVDLVSKVTQALSNKVGLKCKYLTTNSSNFGERLLFPTAIFYDGKTWMFRAFHSESNMYKNFNFVRVMHAKVLHDVIAQERETTEADGDWTTKIPIVLKLHPSLKEQEELVVRKDFGLEDGTNEFTYFERAALVYYLIDNWNIDVALKASAKSQKGYKFHLVLREMLGHFVSTKRIIS